MTRTQIQLPDPLNRRLKAAAARMDWSLAELIRRSAESYLQTLPEESIDNEREWQMPVLRRSGGYVADPANVINPEVSTIESQRK